MERHGALRSQTCLLLIWAELPRLALGLGNASLRSVGVPATVSSRALQFRRSGLCCFLGLFVVEVGIIPVLLLGDLRLLFGFLDGLGCVGVFVFIVVDDSGISLAFWWSRVRGISLLCLLDGTRFDGISHTR